MNKPIISANHNRRRFIYALIISILLGVNSLGTSYAKSTQYERKILPYIQAKGGTANKRVMSLGWANANEVLYLASYTLHADGAKERLPDKFIEHLDRQYKVNLFNIASKESMFYRNGRLLNVTSGIATTLVKHEMFETEPRGFSYELMVGPVGADVSMVETTIYGKRDNTRYQQCPGYEEIFKAKRFYIRRLKPEHGCVLQPSALYPNKDPHIYLRANGEETALPIPADDDVGNARWIDWLGAYLLGDTVTALVGGPVPNVPINTPTLKLLYPTGELKLVNMGEFSLIHAVPTRAGMVAASNGPDNGLLIRPANGLVLWRNGHQYRITEGKVHRTAVSPDGCKVAFYAEKKPIFAVSGDIYLRVIDVCKGFDVAADANPFSM